LINILIFIPLPGFWKAVMALNRLRKTLFQARGIGLPRGRPKGKKTAKRKMSDPGMSLRAIMKNMIKTVQNGEVKDIEIVIRPLK
jgi:hypothetical protein